MKALETAVLIGCSPLDFWELTPYELGLMIRFHNEKMERESEEKITLAWLSARWTIQWLGKKSNHPPTLKELLNKNSKPKIMTDEEMLKQVKQLNALFGGEVRNQTPKERSVK